MKTFHIYLFSIYGLKFLYLFSLGFLDYLEIFGKIFLFGTIYRINDIFTLRVLNRKFHKII